MELRVLSSSSRGNGYILCNDKEALLLEAGVPIQDVLSGLDFNTKKVVGCLISHSHGDHSKSAGKLQSYGIGVCMSEETAKEVKGLRFPPEVLRAGEQITIGGFTVLPFDLVHDVACLGFLISHEEIGKMCFITDTAYSPYTFDGLTNVMIECNYHDKLLDKNIDEKKLHPLVGVHVKRGHLSLTTCIDTLKSNDLSQVVNIVLIHLSDQNGDSDLFHSEITKSTGKIVHVAKPGLIIPFNKHPF